MHVYLLLFKSIKFLALIISIINLYQQLTTIVVVVLQWKRILFYWKKQSFEIYFAPGPVNDRALIHVASLYIVRKYRANARHFFFYSLSLRKCVRDECYGVCVVFFFFQIFFQVPSCTTPFMLRKVMDGLMMGGGQGREERALRRWFVRGTQQPPRSFSLARALSQSTLAVQQRYPATVVPSSSTWSVGTDAVVAGFTDRPHAR